LFSERRRLQSLGKEVLGKRTGIILDDRPRNVEKERGKRTGIILDVILDDRPREP
jgi:hypothetical protein